MTFIYLCEEPSRARTAIASKICCEKAPVKKEDNRIKSNEVGLT